MRSSAIRCERDLDARLFACGAPSRELSEDRCLRTALTIAKALDHRRFGRIASHRQHRASLCERARSSGEWDPALPNEPQRAFFFWVRSHLHEQGIDDSHLARALWRRLLPYEHPTLYHVGAFAVRLLPRVRRES
jgi:hypothetical protein